MCKGIIGLRQDTIYMEQVEERITIQEQMKKACVRHYKRKTF